MCRKCLDKIEPYKPGKPIDEVKRELGLKRVIKLASNENPLAPSLNVLKAIESEAKSINRYPDSGCFYLKKALSRKLSVSEENIIFGNGSDEIIILALNAFVDAGEEVVVADPTFLIYKIASMIKGAKVRTVPLKNYKYDLKGMLNVITKNTKMVFLANPDNPTGTYVTDGELKNFIEKINEKTFVFIDEAYYEFAKGGDYPETIKLIERKDRNIIISRTFSKAYSLAGLRIGYGIARKDLIKTLNKVREPFNVNSLAQVAALAALKDTKHLSESTLLVKREKKRFYEVFDSLGIKYISSRTNFILIDAGREASEIFDYLLKKGIIVRKMSAWGLDNFVRVTIGLPEENDAFFKAFKEKLI